MPFRIGPTELIIIMVIVLLIFGAKRLPQIGSAMGRAIRSFQQGLSVADEKEVDNQED